jgi:hypothetical protein
MTPEIFSIFYSNTSFVAEAAKENENTSSVEAKSLASKKQDPYGFNADDMDIDSDSDVSVSEVSSFLDALPDEVTIIMIGFFSIHNYLSYLFTDKASAAWYVPQP